MTLWIVLTIMVAVAVAVLTVPLVRRYDARATEDGATRAVLARQLADIDGQAAAGAIAPAEADALRIEAKRRLLVEGARAERVARPLGAGSLGQLAVGLAVVVTLGGTLLYARLGSPERDAAPLTPPPGAVASTAPAAGDADIAATVTKLEERLRAEPDSVEGWRLLGSTRYGQGEFGKAAAAFARAAALAPEQAELQSALGESLMLAAQGQVTPDAKAAFTRAVAADAADARARFFLGVALVQAGDRRGAVDAWAALLNSAPDGAPWVPGVRDALTRTAAEAGIDLAGRLRPAGAAAAPALAPPPLIASPAAPGPTAEQMAAAAAMAPADQARMIEGMVTLLEQRLKSNPQDPDGWLRLIRARRVLGGPAAAAATRDTALQALTDPAARARIVNATKAFAGP